MDAIERFDIRLPAATKQMLQQAAEITGCSLTALVLNAATDKAREIIHTHKTFTLNNQEWDELLAALESDAEPNDKLKAAFQDYDNAGMR